MWDLGLLAAFIAGYFLLMRYVLPAAGVPT
jgi:hypothetical protein